MAKVFSQLQLLQMLEVIHAGRGDPEMIDDFVLWLEERKQALMRRKIRKAPENRLAHGHTGTLIMTLDWSGWCEHDESVPAEYNRTLDFMICTVCHKRRDRRRPYALS